MAYIRDNDEWDERAASDAAAGFGREDPDPPPAGESEELTLAYMSIDTMKARIHNLELENKTLQAENDHLRTYRRDPHHTYRGGGTGYVPESLFDGI